MSQILRTFLTADKYKGAISSQNLEIMARSIFSFPLKHPYPKRPRVTFPFRRLVQMSYCFISQILIQDFTLFITKLVRNWGSCLSTPRSTFPCVYQHMCASPMTANLLLNKDYTKSKLLPNNYKDHGKENAKNK